MRRCRLRIWLGRIELRPGPRTLRETMSCKRNGAQRISPAGRSVEMRIELQLLRIARSRQRQVELRLREQRRLQRWNKRVDHSFLVAKRTNCAGGGTRYKWDSSMNRDAPWSRRIIWWRAR